MIDANLEAARNRILDAGLVLVPAMGWTAAMLDRAVTETGVDLPLATRAFPHGPATMIDAFHARADAAMETELAARDLDRVKIRDRIGLAVRLRLLAMEPHREAARRALVVQAAPRNLLTSAAGLARTADAIWYGIGDTSTDFSFYTKRALVGGVYASTSVVWFSDRSPDFEESWAFLERRISDALKLGGLRRRLKAGLGPSLGDLLERLPGRRGTRPLWRRFQRRQAQG